MTDRLRLSPRHRRLLEALLQKHAPNVEVWGYGSRVNGSAHEASDLDLVLRTSNLEPLGPEFSKGIYIPVYHVYERDDIIK